MRRRGVGHAASLTFALLAIAIPAVAAVPAGTAPQRTWNFDQIQVPSARAAGRFGSGVTVAVLDSWVDGSHRDFEGRVLAGADCVGGSCRPGPVSPDKCDHGTHVAGTVASSSFGVATKARILPVRVLTFDDKTGTCVGQPVDVAAGIRWAVGHGARILNLSLGPDVPGLASSSTTISDAVTEAAQQGAVVIFSAGNSTAPVANSYGTAAVIVAATSRSGQLASYSQRGPGVDLAAPGGDPQTKDACTQVDCVTSLYPGNRYAVAAGTSMAAPHVSGVAALVLGQDPTRSRTQVIARMEDTARPLAQAGHGLLDAAAALGVTESASTPRSTTSALPVQVVPALPTLSDSTAASAPPLPLRVLNPATTSRPAAPRTRPRPTAGRLRRSAAVAARPRADALPAGVVVLAAGLIVAAAISFTALGRRPAGS